MQATRATFHWNHLRRLLLGLSLFIALTLVLIPATPAYAAPCAGTAITGTAFRDYNASGVQDVLEPGISGIVVTVYDTIGGSASCETTADGSYGIDPANGSSVRIEFTLPADGSLNFLRPGPVGSGSSSTVTFVESPAAQVNVGFSNPADFCGQNSSPTLATSCFVFGEQNDNVNGVNKDKNVMYSFPYNAGSTTLTDAAAVSSPLPGQLAMAKQMGSVWGLAWSPKNGTLYAAAFLKRHAGFGPSGPGAIYQITPSGPTLFHDFGPALVGADPHPQPGQTCASPGHNPADPTVMTNDNCWLNDTNSFDLVGKGSFGDLDIADDFNTLYTLNLLDRTLLAIPIANPSAFVATPVPTPANCPAADTRPFGLGVKDGKVYVGMVCSAESTVNRANLRAYVYAFANGAFAAAPALEIDLSAYRGSGNVQWRYWLNRTTFNPTNVDQAAGKWGQPSVADIAFDGDSMILSLRDRNADQFGTVAGGPDPADPANYTAFARGDILRACPNGSGGWQVENNGSCGGITTAGAGNGQGPGGGEYYFEDQQFAPNHVETTLGGQVQIPGQPDVVSLIYNPIEGMANDARSDGGVKWYNNLTGTTTRSYLLFDGTGEIAFFDKANGLGDLVALCDPAPLEIGNRVWNDTDGDGIQDPGELGIDGVDVELYFSGQLIGTVTTANGGLYLFNSNVDAPNGIQSATGTPGGASAYELRIRNVTGPNQPLALAGLSLTLPNSDITANGDARDSDGALVGLDASYTIPYAALQGPGYNDHTQDFGFTPALLPFSLGNLVWHDANNSGSVDNGEVGLPNVTVNLYLDADNNGVADGAAIATQQTNATGNYLFTGLLANTYLVEVVTPAGWLSSSGGSTEPAADGDDNPADNDDNGTTSATVVRSAPLTLGGGEPLGEPATPGLPDVTPDANANYTLDFGFYAPVSVGNFVWFDSDQNGLQANTEPGVPNVTVRLFNADNTPARDTAGTLVPAQSTDGNGQYLFSNLPPGAYKVTFDLATLPLNHVVTVPNAGADDLDSDAAPSNGETAATPFLPSGSQDLTLDMGIYPLANVRVGDYVWVDTNGNGRQESGEPGVGGVTVTLFQANGTPTNLTQVTDNNGFYLFSNLPVGNYYVVFNLATLPAGFVATGQDMGGDDTLDSDANSQTGQTAPTGPLDAGQQNLTLDLGILQLAALGGCTWNDGLQDVADGVLNPGEQILPGVIVILTNANGQEVTRTTTDANGCYLFDPLSPGNYTVIFELPNGFIGFTLSNQVPNGSDADPVSGQTVLINLEAGERDLTWDAGFVQNLPTGEQPGEEPTQTRVVFLPFVRR